MNDFEYFTCQVVSWANRRLPNRTVQSALLKLTEEHGELIRDPSNPDEYADILIMLLDLANMHEVDIRQALINKIRVNETRNWLETPTGTYQHE